MISPDLSRPFFLAGIGGSGMLPLALILKGRGASVAGSDRSHDQGRTPEKFAWLKAQGITLFPQDGSGITSARQVLVASAAVEDSVPEVVRAKALGCARMSRAQLLSSLFNAAPLAVGVAGTSGKSTTTAMLGWIMHQAGLDPTIMNGAVMKNFATPGAPFASARIGQGAAFLSEIDESDGSIALYRPAVGVLLNVSLDHKSMDELRGLFGDFLARCPTAAVNCDDPEARALAGRSSHVIGFGITSPEAAIGIEPGSITARPDAMAARVVNRLDGSCHALTLPMPGQHNLANALAAIAGALGAGIAVADSLAALQQFRGLARRFEILGTSARGVQVIDDFAHNPEKCRATLATLKAQPGRLLAFFQPHGYGPLRQMGAQLARAIAAELGPEDHIILCDPVYFGGTVDRSQGSERIVEMIRNQGRSAEYIARREDCAERLRRLSRPGDRIIIMGARDDSLSLFARELLASL